MALCSPATFIIDPVGCVSLLIDGASERLYIDLRNNHTVLYDRPHPAVLTVGSFIFPYPGETLSTRPSLKSPRPWEEIPIGVSTDPGQCDGILGLGEGSWVWDLWTTIYIEESTFLTLSCDALETQPSLNVWPDDVDVRQWNVQYSKSQNLLLQTSRSTGDALGTADLVFTVFIVTAMVLQGFRKSKSFLRIWLIWMTLGWCILVGNMLTGISFWIYQFSGPLVEASVWFLAAFCTLIPSKTYWGLFLLYITGVRVYYTLLGMGHLAIVGIVTLRLSMANEATVWTVLGEVMAMIAVAWRIWFPLACQLFPLFPEWLLILLTVFSTAGCCV
jgi:hypothetical protein